MNEHVLNLNLLIFIAAERYLALGEGGGGKTDYKKKKDAWVNIQYNVF